jgi:TPR repeat protein
MASIPVDKDSTKAFYWHKRAAEAGNAEAAYIIMTTFLTSVPKSLKEATEYGLKAITNGGGVEVMKVEQPALFITVFF